MKSVPSKHIDEFIRNKIFYFEDLIKGGAFVRNVDELSGFEGLPVHERITHVQEALMQLAEDITQHVPFYSKYARLGELSAFPVVNKRLIASDPEQFHSDRFEADELVKVHTSGSYGTPLTFRLTRAKKKRQHAEVFFYGNKCGFNIGCRYGYFRSVSAKSGFKRWRQNESFFASKRLDDTFVERSLKLLKGKRPGFLVGFPSAISFLADRCLGLGYKPDDFAVRGVITQSENLTKHHREVIRKAFGSEVCNRYSTEEFGVLGCEYTLGEGFGLNCCNYIVEVLALESDRSVGVGELGRIVVTDLHSNAMPLVRYETGDLGVVGSFLDSGRGWVSTLKALSGRVMQMISDTNGTPLYPLYFDNIMDQFDCFSQYQLIQTSAATYSINLVLNQSSGATYSGEHLLALLHGWLGADANITLHHVTDIVTLPSGKRPFIINQYTH